MISPTKGSMVTNLLLALALCVPASAQTLTLLTPISSKIPQGKFEAKDAAGQTYHGTFISQKAGRFLRRGSVQLRFDESLAIVNNNSEGTIRAGRKKQLIVLGSSLALAKIADDSVDAAIGASKARLVALPVALTLLFLERGGEVKLDPGYEFEVSPTRVIPERFPSTTP
jgi:hypothetical protein